MTDFRPDSYCGLFCGACDIMHTYRSSLETGEPARWEQLPPRFRDHLRQADVVCRGCKTDVLFEGCKNCRVRICASGKGVEACIECPDYPCEEVQGRLDYVAGTLKHVLPHTKVMFRNMDALAAQGIAGWVADQEQRWRCPQCGTPFTWYQDTCTRCGLDLEPVKDYQNYD